MIRPETGKALSNPGRSPTPNGDVEAVLAEVVRPMGTVETAASELAREAVDEAWGRREEARARPGEFPPYLVRPQGPTR